MLSPGSAHRVYSAIGVEEPYSYTCSTNAALYLLFRSFPDVTPSILLLRRPTVGVNVSSHGYYVSSSILAIFRSDQTLLFVVEEPRPLHWTRTSYCCRSGSCFPDKLLEGYRRLDEGSTTQTWAHIHLYTAPRLQYRSEIVISEPWPSARLMELPVRIERTSEHYKCPVLTFVLWEHILYGRGGWI